MECTYDLLHALQGQCFRLDTHPDPVAVSMAAPRVYLPIRHVVSVHCPAGPMSSPDVDGLLVVTPGALDTGAIMPTDLSGHNEDRRPGRKPSAQAGAGFTLPEAMTGRASPAKAAVGDKPVFAYIDSLPQPQRGIAEAIDALAAETLPGLQRSVKWGMAYYGVGDGWCFSCGGFAGHVKVMFINGVDLRPVPPVAPVGMGKATRGVELESIEDVDARQLADWMKQVASVPGVGGRKR